MESNLHKTLSKIINLLIPIQAPAKNWEVDLASHLEEFLRELAKLGSGRDDKLNFVEAAVLVQRSAGVYSKKVDYLSELMEEVLNSFQVKRPGNKSNTSRKKALTVSMEGESENAETWGPLEELTLDDQTWSYRPNIFKVEPPIICDMEQTEASKLDIEVFDQTMDKLGKRSDFRMNNIISGIGMLESEFTIHAAPMGIANGVQSVEPNFELNNSHNELPDIPVNVDENMEVAPDNDSYHEPDDNRSPSPLPEAAELNDSDIPVQRNPAARPNEELVVDDPWKNDKLEEYVSKPINPKTTRKMPCDRNSENTDRKRKITTRFKEKDIKLMADFLNSDMVRARLSKNTFEGFPRFAVQLLNAIKKYRKKLERRKKLEEIQALKLQLATEFEGEFLGFEDTEFSSDEEEEGFRGYQDEMPDDDDHTDADADPEPASRDDIPARIVASPVVENQNGSIQALLQEKLNEYFNKNQLVQSELANRVHQWHESIRPVLDAAEKRVRFDIHEYGTRVLGSFPEGNRKTTIPFAAVVDGKPKEDVARYFLSSLMLANTYNIEISKSDPRELAMDCMELTLLTTVRHHEDLQDYEAPSQQSRRDH